MCCVIHYSNNIATYIAMYTAYVLNHHDQLVAIGWTSTNLLSAALGMYELLPQVCDYVLANCNLQYLCS